MPQFDYTLFSSQLFWLFINFFFLHVVIVRFFIPRISLIFKQREERISGVVDSATELHQKARMHSEEYRTILQNARQESEQIMKAALAHVTHQKENLEREFNTQMTQRLQGVEKQIAEHKRSVLANVESITIELVLSLLQKFTPEQSISEDEIAASVTQLMKSKGMTHHVQ